MTFLECCQTVRKHGLRMIRPREHTPGLYDMREPFEAGGRLGLAGRNHCKCRLPDLRRPLTGSARDLQDPAGVRDPEILLEDCKWHIAFI